MIIIQGPPAPTSPLINKYIYTLLRSQYVSNGCKNTKVRYLWQNIITFQWGYLFLAIYITIFDACSYRRIRFFFKFYENILFTGAAHLTTGIRGSAW